MQAARLRRSLVVILAAIVLWTAGCVKQPPAPSEQDQAPAVEYLYHTVKYPGETLSIIAGWYTGQARHWEEILEHNPGLDVKRIRLGDVIAIPRRLVVKSESLPERAVRGGVRRPADSQAVAPVVEAPRSPAVQETALMESEAMPPRSATPQILKDLEPEPVAATVVIVEESLVTVVPATAVPTLAAPTEAPPTLTPLQPTAVPTVEKRIKTREELLRELLAE